jgi:broad specificity phosphatase PhoE
MQLILIRHGETLWNKEGRIQGISDVELSAAGFEQARLLAVSLKDHPIKAIHASTLKRALQTAEIINEFHRKEIHTHQDLMEMDQGDFEGVYFKKLIACEKDFMKKWINDPASVQMPNGESLTQLQKRAWRAMEKIISKEENALVVAHNLTIASIICRIRSINLNEFLSACVDNASKTIVRFQKDDVFIETFNDSSHLPKDIKPSGRFSEC